MALTKLGQRAQMAVMEIEEPIKALPKAPARKVLDEETYSEDLETIIARDFFPDLAKLKAQKEYMEAMEKNDLVKMRELALKYASTGGLRHNRDTPNSYGQVTPATFETPDAGSSQQSSPGSQRGSNSNLNPEEPLRRIKRREKEDDTGEKKKSNPSLTLDKYLNKHTSEDNASFGDIMEVSEIKRKQKHMWLYEAEQRHHEEQKEMLKLKSAKEMLAIQSAPGSSLNTWDYQTKNSLMYVPEGVELSSEEKLKNLKEREIVHSNTRLTSDPFSNVSEKTTMAQAAANKVFKKQGKVGPDGKEILASESPQVNGYRFVATPSPAPGVNESPVMTWGEIEGTPFRLDGSDTPMRHSGPGPAFKMPAVPRRERLGISLVEEVTKKHRAKKQEALKRVAENLVSPSPKRLGTLGSVERLHTLSPAAQKLVSKKLACGGTDKALRASYTPSPSQRGLCGDKTPRLTPRKTPGGTPGGTPGKTPNKTPNKATEFNTGLDNSTLTDNLLNLPKRNARAKATDFF